MDEEDDLQKEISMAPNNRINHISNDQGDVEAPTAEGDVEICPGDEALMLMPPQYLKDEVVDSDPITEKKVSGHADSSNATPEHQ